LPKLAEGGVAQRATQAVVGDRPEVILPLDDDIISKLGGVIGEAVPEGGAQMVHVTVNMGPEQLYDRISQASREGRVIIDSRRGVR